MIKPKGGHTMKRLHIGMTDTLLAGVLALGGLALPPTWGQTSPSLQQVEAQLQEKQSAAEAHQQQMQSITDPAQRAVEMRRHFRMTEEILALMLDRQHLMATLAGTGSTPERGAPGGHRGQHAGMTPASGMPEQLAGMPQRGAPGGPLRQHGKEPGQGSGASDLEQMLQRITEHSAYRETLTDQTLLTQEMSRHQQMLDQMLERLRP
jgi:hypothetical protein